MLKPSLCHQNSLYYWSDQSNWVSLFSLVLRAAVSSASSSDCCALPSFCLAPWSCPPLAEVCCFFCPLPCPCPCSPDALSDTSPVAFAFVFPACGLELAWPSWPPCPWTCPVCPWPCRPWPLACPWPVCCCPLVPSPLSPCLFSCWPCPVWLTPPKPNPCWFVPCCPWGTELLLVFCPVPEPACCWLWKGCPLDMNRWSSKIKLRKAQRSAFSKSVSKGGWFTGQVWEHLSSVW